VNSKSPSFFKNNVKKGLRETKETLPDAGDVGSVALY
jgi:hypothetical protein